jgi:hypothetical protein
VLQILQQLNRDPAADVVCYCTAWPCVAATVAGFYEQGGMRLASGKGRTC